MITVMEWHKDSIRQVKPSDMHFEAIKWMDCVNPTKDDFKCIQDITKIPIKDLKRIENDERPDVYEFEHFSMLFAKHPFQERRRYRTRAMAVISSKHLIITIRFKDEELFKPVFENGTGVLEAAFRKGTSSILNLVLERITNRYFEILDEIEKRVDHVEHEVFTTPKESTTKSIFELKTGLIHFHRALSANRDLLIKLEGGMGDQIESRQLKNLRFIHSDTVQLMDIAATYRETLVSVMDIYHSSVSNNLNVVMKRMTSLGSLVLVPMFITGLYGMNFRHLPEFAWKYGYAFAWMLIIFSVLILFVYFKKKDWF